MGLIKRGERAYYYKCRRVGGRPVNTLVASGELAEDLAEQGRAERARRSAAAAEARERRADRRVARSSRAEAEESDRPIVEAVESALGVALDAARAALASAGYRERRGEWRRTRGNKTMADEGHDRFPTINRLLDDVIGNKRRPFNMEDGRCEISGTRDDPDDRAASERRIGEHLRKAWAGDASELDAVRRAFRRLADHDARPPDGTVKERRKLLPEAVADYGGCPTARAEDALIRRLSESKFGLYTEEAIRISLEAFRDGLLGPDPTAIERVLVDAIGCAWLALTQAEEAAAQSRGAIELREYLDRRVERAGRRLNNGLKTLALVRRKCVPGVALQVNLAMVAPPPADAVGSDGPARQIVAGGATPETSA